VKIKLSGRALLYENLIGCEGNALKPIFRDYKLQIHLIFPKITKTIPAETNDSEGSFRAKEVGDGLKEQQYFRLGPMLSSVVF
jgi:hypothetical protein